MAQALQIRVVVKKRLISAMRNNMVNLRCTRPHASFGAFPAERLLQKMELASLSPFFREVPPPPDGLVRSSLFLRPMPKAEFSFCQFRAARKRARPQRLICHNDPSIYYFTVSICDIVTTFIFRALFAHFRFLYFPIPSNFPISAPIFQKPDWGLFFTAEWGRG